MAADRRLTGVTRVCAVALALALALAAVVLAGIAYELRGLSTDIGRTHARLPSTVRAQLPSHGGTLDTPQVTLVRYSSGLASGATVLFSTVPSRTLAAFLSLPPGMMVGNTPLRRQSTPEVIRALRREGIPVSHVALVDASDVTSLVDGVGGITVFNPTAFTTTTASGQTVRYGRGPQRLDGAQAADYVHAVTTRRSLESGNDAVLTGILRATLASAQVQRLRSIGSALAGATSTDLTTADVIGLVDLRLQGGEALECRLRSPGRLTDPQARSVIDQVLGKTAAIARPCRARQLSAATFAPPAAVVRAVQRYGWKLFAIAALVMALLAAAAAAVLALRAPPAPSPTPRLVPWPPASTPLSQINRDVVWARPDAPAGAETPPAAPADLAPPPAEPVPEPQPAPAPEGIVPPA
jgi:hypothetical protein